MEWNGCHTCRDADFKKIWSGLLFFSRAVYIYIYILFLLTSAHNLTFLLQNCWTDCRHFRHVGGLWSNEQHGLGEIAPDGQVWEFLAIF